MNSAGEMNNRRGHGVEGPELPASPGQELIGHLLPELYHMDATHWWTSGMRRISHALLDGVDLPDGPLLELGCGAGAFLAELSSRFPARLVSGSDVHPLALARASQRGKAGPPVVAADVHRLPYPAGCCAAIVALDVLDQHSVNLPNALRECWRVLGNDGILLLRVSAFPWLQGPHDVAFGTGRRYTARQIERSLAGAGWHLQRLTYANSVLLAPSAALRLLHKLGVMADVASKLSVSPQLSRLLSGILAAEARWLRQHNLPAGLSLYAIARKLDTSLSAQPGRDRR